MSLSAAIDSVDNRDKANDFRPDPDAQRVLFETNRHLQPLEVDHFARAARIPDPELVLISYVPRSGSTLLSQLLASSGRFNYVSNFQARFWLAPYVGGMLERSISPRDHQSIDLSSSYGLTTSSSSPSEFSYFWKHWLRLDDAASDTLNDQQWSQLDIEALRLELRLIGSLHAGPLMFKKEWLGMNAGHFLREFPNARIIHVQRSPLDVALSIQKARTDVFGGVEHWWAGRPSNISELYELSWPDQIAGQIQGILHDINRCQEQHPDRFLSVDYETLVLTPEQILQRCCDWLDVRNAEFQHLPQHLSANVNPHETEVASKLQDALARRQLI